MATLEFASDHDQQGFFHRHVAARFIQRFLYAVGGGLEHLQIDRQFATVADIDPVIAGGPRVQHRRNVVLCVTGREQHAGHGENVVDPLIDQLAQPVLDHRRGEFQKPVFDGNAVGPFAYRDRQFFELGNRAFIAAAMAAHHDACGQMSLPFRQQLISRRDGAIVAG